MQTSLFDKPKARTKPKPSLIPRDYQETGIKEAFRLWDSGVPGVLFRQPTGSGKTVSGTLIADEWLQRGDDHRVLVLAHERQLIQQFAEEIEGILHFRPAIEMGDQHCSGKEPLIVASRQTLKVKGDGDDAISRLYKFDPSLNWLVILDECHRWKLGLVSCGHIIKHFEQNPKSRRLGLTATPERTDKVSLAKIFPGIASDYRLNDIAGGKSAVNDGWAVPYDQRFIVVEGVDFKNIREIAKDFDKNELERILGDQEVLAKLCTPLLDLVGRRRTIIFSPGTAMARDVALYINSQLGYEAAVSLDGSYPDDDRKEVYRRHQTGDFQFLSVCGLCREGYNDPGIQAVAIFRPTKSRPLAEQMKGRGCRPLRGVVSSEMTDAERKLAIQASDKPSCMIVDLVGVTGIADCASTASIMAEGIEDEVIERANANMLVKGTDEPSDVADEIRKAQKQITDEREAKEKARLEAILRREEEKKRRQEEMDKRAKLQADVRYQAMQVGSGGGGKVYGSEVVSDRATAKQVGFLRWKGVQCGNWDAVSKAQAGRMINQINQGATPAEVLRTNSIAATIPPKSVRNENKKNQEAGKQHRENRSRRTIDEMNEAFLEARYGRS